MKAMLHNARQRLAEIEASRDSWPEAEAQLAAIEHRARRELQTLNAGSIASPDSNPAALVTASAMGPAQLSTDAASSQPGAGRPASAVAGH